MLSLAKSCGFAYAVCNTIVILCVSPVKGGEMEIRMIISISASEHLRQKKEEERTVIFLDIDGELTYTGYRNEETHNIDPKKVALLKEIVDATDAKIVLSSSWKCGYNKITGEKKIFYRTLENILSAMGLFIYDITEDIPGIMTKEKEQPWQEDKTISLGEYEKIHFQYGTGRAAEVKKWIDDHAVESF